MSKRTYGQLCGLARAMELVGERWTLLIVRDLSLGPQRYTDLVAGMPGLGTGLLASRLRDLEAIGVARKTTLAPPANVAVYELTEDGRGLADALLPLTRWGAGHLDASNIKRHTYRADWIAFSLRSAMEPAESVGVSETYEIHVGGEVVHVVADDGHLQVARGPSPAPPALRVRTDVETFLSVGLRSELAHAAVAVGRMRLEGDEAAFDRCIRIFGLETPPRPTRPARPRRAPAKRAQKAARAK